MKKLVIVFFMLLITFQPLHATIADDKIAHFMGSAYLTKLFKSYGLGSAESALLTMLIGAMKEAHDFRNGVFDVEDMNFNMYGVIFSLSVDKILDI